MSIEFDKDKFDVTISNGVANITYTDKEAFFKNTKIPKKVLKEVFDYENEYILAANIEGAKQAKNLMGENKNLDEVVTELPFSPSARGKVTVVGKRSQKFRSPKDGSEIVKSTLRTIVKNPFLKVSDSKIKELTKDMTETLLS